MTSNFPSCENTCTKYPNQSNIENIKLIGSAAFVNALDGKINEITINPPAPIGTELEVEIHNCTGNTGEIKAICTGASNRWTLNGECSECKDGWYGRLCEENCSEGCDGRCNKKNGECKCTIGFYGATCKKSCGAGCPGDGSCDVKSGECECKSGFTGSGCQVCTESSMGIYPNCDGRSNG